MLGLVFAAAACTQTPTSTTESPEPAAAAATTTADTNDAGTEQPTVSSQLDWFIGVLNGSDLTADEYESRFVPEFLEQVPYEAFTELTAQIAGEGVGWTVTSTETEGSDNAVVLVSPSAGTPVLRVLINIDENGVIDGLFIQPGENPSLDDPPESYQDAFDQLATQGMAAVLVAETTNGSCEPIASLDPDAELPIGSMFKLYVLGALADQIAEGVIEWDDPVVLDERFYSHPSGETQNDEPGTTVSVRELAERMISISDNTATDHLVALVGRPAVEAVQSAMGHSDPSLNIPFLTTRELFQLKLGDPATLDEYVNGDQSKRQAVLDGLAAEPLPPISIDSFVDPIAPLDAEWFATPADMCRAWVGLAERARQPGLDQLTEILGLNPGIADEAGDWDDIWFKGGSEPGVLGLSWYLVRGDRSFVVAGMVGNAEAPLDQTEASLLLGAVRDLLAEDVTE